MHNDQHFYSWLGDTLRDGRDHCTCERRDRLHALRGAITVLRDDASCIAAAVHELLREMAAANSLLASDVVSAIFTMTPDLCSSFPATAARELAEWKHVPLLCATEIDMPGALPRCIRVLVHAYGTWSANEVRHVYMGDAQTLRPDLATPGSVLTPAEKGRK